MDEKSETSAASSWRSTWDDEVEGAYRSRTPPNHPPQVFSFMQQQGGLSGLSPDSLEPDGNMTDQNIAIETNSASVPADQERQILLLMLLAQVCALHDPTPRTFTVHVLELFERGILDRQSIHFLFDLGLVPSSSPSRFLSSNANVYGDPSADQGEEESSKQTAIALSTKPFYRQRSLEASAIRSSLEHEERQRVTTNSATKSDPYVAATTLPWSAEHHPLSLSRYKREFDEVGLLSSGSFGQVFRATNKMDGFNYAVKRVPFNATGFSSDSVQQVVREVHCLAVCDHPNVVRYYTSWLEPSWMTGSGTSNAISDLNNHPRLLADIESAFSGDNPQRLSDTLQAYFQDPVFSDRPRRRFSLDGSNAGDTEEFSLWTIDQTQDDSVIGMKWHRRSLRHPSNSNQLSQKSGRARKGKKAAGPSYQYQICLYIQMQLCHPATLADWIRERNRKLHDEHAGNRLVFAADIFSQLCDGLAHVHSKGIVHRDLKPANVFASQDEKVQFKIGDFGLSKMIESLQTNKGANQGKGWKASQPLHLLLKHGEAAFLYDSQIERTCGNDTWRDPLTAGVGTASYAAPEQVSSGSYGKEADIFSLGLICLELLCCFSTEHERIQTFHDCRYQRSLPLDLEQYSLVSDVILKCTEPDPRRRPTAAELCSFNINPETAENNRNPNDVEALLRRQLSQRDAEIEKYKTSIEERDHAIASLRLEIEALKRKAPFTFRAGPFDKAHSDFVAVSKSFSSQSSSSDEGL
jgi:serine/threonine protein kinase